MTLDLPLELHASGLQRWDEGGIVKLYRGEVLFAQAELLAAQLQTALTSRVAIEQAKGVLSERRRVSVDEAFALLRGHARDHNLRLSDLARLWNRVEDPFLKVRAHLSNTQKQYDEAAKALGRFGEKLTGIAEVAEEKLEKREEVTSPQLSVFATPDP